MTQFDVGVLTPFLTLLFFWIRGIWKHSKGDLAFSGVLLIVSVVAYVYFGSFTRFVGLPWIVMLVCAIAPIIVGLVKRDQVSARGRRALFVVAPLCLSVVLFFGEKEWNTSSNSILVIEPYRLVGTWVFDDPKVGLKAEPFVSGIPELIDKLVAEASIQEADKGFRLIFSSQPFPGHQTRVVWRRRESAGNWYYSEEYDMEGWLCPALFRYFKRAPKEIYVKAETK